MSKVTTGTVRLSYEHLFEKASVNGSEEKYSASFIIPKSDKKTLTKIKTAIESAIAEGISSKWGGVRPKKLKLPLRDGDEERDDEAYVNSMFVNANSKSAPFVVDRNKNEIIDRDEVYSGCYGVAAINFYPYDSNGNKGVACGVDGFMKTKDGEPLGSKVSLDDLFNDVEFDDSDDEFE